MPDTLSKIKERLYPYQKDWLEDQSDFKIWVKSRRIGGSYAMVLEALARALRFPGTNHVLVSTKVGNAREQLLNKIKGNLLDFLEQDDKLGPIIQSAKINKNEIVLKNINSKLIAEAYEPTRLRGHSNSSFYLDECAHWPQRVYNEIEDAIFPQIDDPHNDSSCLRMISTPRDENLFFDIYTDSKYDFFSRKKTDIYDAVEDGLDFDIEKEKKKYTPEKWKREFLCEFGALSGKYFDHQQIKPLQSSACSAGGPSYIGIDLGQKDYSVLLHLEEGDDEKLHVKKCFRARRLPYNQISRLFSQLLDNESEKILIDETKHPFVAEKMEDQFPQAEGVAGDRKRKVEQTQNIKKLIEENEICIHEDEFYEWKQGETQTKALNDSELNDYWTRTKPYLSDDLASVEQDETRAGNIRFNAKRSEEGHADSWDALILALEARETDKFFCKMI